MAQLSGHAHASRMNPGVVYAGFWRRLLAYLIDVTLLVTVQGALAAWLFLIVPDDRQALANVAPVSAAIAWAYYAILESSPARGTMGKMALDLIVADLHGDPISFWRASARYWLKILSTLLLMSGWLMAAFTPRKQALHDTLAGTLVLRRVHSSAGEPAATAEPGDYWNGSHWVGPAPSLEER